MSETNGVEPMLKVTRSLLDHRRRLRRRPDVERNRGRLEDDRHQHAVEEARLVRVGRAHEQDVALGERDVVG